jgi:alpha-1,2-mannosyltransferase
VRSSDPEGRPSAIRNVLAVVAVLALVFVVGLAWYLLFIDGEGPYTFVDLDYYREALKTVVAQDPLYAALPYPPVAVLAIAWLAGLPAILGNQLWTAASLLTALWLAALLATRSFQARGEEHPKPSDYLASASIAGLLLVASWPMYSQLTNGQLTLLIITLTFLDVAKVLPRKAQGILVGVAGAIKLTPLIFIPYYLVTGQRRQAAVATASFGAATALGFALFPGDSLFFWTHLGKNDQFGDPARIDNLSLHAAIARWIPAAGSSILWLGLGLVVAVFAMIRARRHFQAGEWMEAALTVGASAVVIAPIAWPHYHMWVMLAGLWMLSFPHRRHQLLGLGVVIAYSLPFTSAFMVPAGQGNLLAMAAFDLKVLIPVLIGLFGLPHRLSTSSAVEHPDTVPTAA